MIVCHRNSYCQIDCRLNTLRFAITTCPRGIIPFIPLLRRWEERKIGSAERRYGEKERERKGEKGGERGRERKEERKREREQEGCMRERKRERTRGVHEREKERENKRGA